MSAGEMMERIAETSPRFKARIAGGLWLMVIAAGMTAFVTTARFAGSIVIGGFDPGADAPSRGPQPSISAGVEDFMLASASRIHPGRLISLRNCDRTLRNHWS